MTQEDFDQAVSEALDHFAAGDRHPERGPIVTEPTYAGFAAYRDGFEPGAPYGHGATEAAAVAALFEVEALHFDDED